MTCSGDRRRRERFDAYCTGLNLPLERKSVEPIAAAVDPDNVSARHQSLLHFVAEAPWSDRALLERIESGVDAAMGDARRYWLVDDTGIPKKGTHSVGVARQYCGQLGKQDNCQVAVSVSLATETASVPVDYRLYLPERWARDAERRGAVGVPEDIEFRTKPEIALEQIRARVARGTTPGTVVADSGYGSDIRLSRRARRARTRLLGGRQEQHPGLGAGGGAAAAEALVGERTTTEEHGHRAGT